MSLSSTSLSVDDAFITNATVKSPEKDQTLDLEESLMHEETFDLEAELIIPPPNGRLTRSIAEKYLANLGPAGDGSTFAYRDLELIGMNLNDIGVLMSFKFIRHLNISNNNLTSLVTLSNMPWLVTLIASNNQLETMLDFKAPNGLRQVDLSYNSISTIPDLSEHPYLESLVLDHNRIGSINGVENCRRLKEFRLAHNKISEIKSLGSLPIGRLDLSYNQLTKIEGLDGLQLLRTLDLSGNRIRSLEGLSYHRVLTTLDLSSNEIIDMAELDYLNKLSILQSGTFSLNLSNNPLGEIPDFRIHVLRKYPNVSVLNNKKVRTDERLAAVFMFNPPMEHVAAVNHSILTVYSFVQPASLEAYTLPDPDMSYPMLVIVGPEGSGREYLMTRLVNEFSEVFSSGALCTSRNLFTDEVDGRELAHIPMEVFDGQVKAGQFLSIYNHGEHVYGFHKQSLEQASNGGTACITHMELEGMLCLRRIPSLRPRYVLTVPLSSDPHESRLRTRGVYSEDEIKEAMARRHLYIDYNNKHPGGFDAVVGTDNLEEAYEQLKKLVLDYLGRGQQQPQEQLQTAPMNESLAFEAETPSMTIPVFIPRNDGAASPTNSNTLGVCIFF